MVDVRTAKHHGVCPTCEGYGGNPNMDVCPNELCLGSCPACRCPGCHDGMTGDPASARAFGIDPEDYAGTWAAYVAVREAKPPTPSRPPRGQEVLDV